MVRKVKCFAGRNKGLDVEVEVEVEVEVMRSLPVVVQYRVRSRRGTLIYHTT